MLSNISFILKGEKLDGWKFLDMRKSTKFGVMCIMRIKGTIKVNLVFHLRKLNLRRI